jgi:hypothetical protein
MLIVSIVSLLLSLFSNYESQIQTPLAGFPLCFSQHSGSVAPNRSTFRNAQRTSFSFTAGNNTIISVCATRTLVRVGRFRSAKMRNMLITSLLTCHIRYLKMSPFCDTGVWGCSVPGSFGQKKGLEDSARFQPRAGKVGGLTLKFGHFQESLLSTEAGLSLRRRPERVPEGHRTLARRFIAGSWSLAITR